MSDQSLARQFTAITSGNIAIKPFELSSITQLEIVQRVNDHARVSLTGVLVREMQDKYIQEVAVDTLLEINRTDGAGAVIKNLFTGRITNITVQRVAGQYLLKVEAVTCTYDLDIKKINRSFQDRQMTFKQLLDQVTADYNAVALDMVTKGKKLEKFILQYQETTWEFLRRLAAREPFQSGLVAELSGAKPKFWFGIPEGESFSEKDLENSAYFKVQKRLSAFRDARTNRISGVAAQDYICYEVETYRPLKIGDTLDFQKQQFVVGEVTTVLIDQLLHYQCVLFPKDGLKQPRLFNNQLTGAWLGGKVLAVEQDHLKVHLAIDAAQSESTACLFPVATAYSAEGHTGWYCMPEIADQVYLFFPGNKEEDAVVVTAVRGRDEQGKVWEGDKITDPKVKYFRTKDNKELSFKEQELVVTGKDEAILIRLDEGKGVEVVSDQEIGIEADQEIAIHSESTVSITADQAIELQCKSSTINLDGRTGLAAINAPRVNKDPGRPAVKKVPATLAKSLQANPAIGKAVAALPAANVVNGLGADTIQKGIHCANGDPVNVASGNFFTRRTDLGIEGYQPLEWCRFYNSIATTTGCLGRGWRHNYQIKLEKLDRAKIQITYDDGHTEEFSAGRDGKFAATGNHNSRLTAAGNGYQLTFGDGGAYHFDAAGNLSVCVDPQGNRINLVYQENRLIRIHNGCGAMQLRYDGDGLLIGITDHAERSVAYSYVNGQLTGFCDADGHYHSYQYDTDGRLLQMIDPLGNVTIANTYDANRRVIAQVMADGTQNTFDYDDTDRLTCYTERNGAMTIYRRDAKDRIDEREYINGSEKLTFNSRDQVVAFEDKNGNQYQYAYDDRGNIIRETDALGNVTGFSYDEQNNVTLVKNPDGSSYRYRYDSRGSLLATVDPLGREFQLEYNGQGLPVQLTLPNGAVVTIGYDPTGNPTTFRDPEGNVTRYSYDRLNRLQQIIRPEGNTVTYEYTPGGKVQKVTYPDETCVTAVYNSKGLLLEETDESGAVTKYQYNSIGKVIAVTDALDGVTKYTYDQMWNIATVTKPDDGVVKYSYNLANLLTSVTDEDGGVRKYEYDNNGNLTAVTDANGNLTIYEYDALDRSVKTVNARNAVTQYEYRFDGKVRQVVDALNGITAYDYDAAGQLIEVKDPSGVVKKYEYNRLGLVAAVTDPNGGVTRYEYNRNGKIKRVIYPDQTSETLEYDRNNNLVRYLDQKDNPTVFTYDNRDRLIAVQNALGGVKKLTYTPVGKLAGLTDENGNHTSYHYDLLHRLTEVVDATGNRTTYNYDPAGNLTEVHQYAGVGAETIARMRRGPEAGYRPELTEIITKYKYDRRGLLLEEANPAGKLTVYSYDANGNLISKTDRDGYQTRFEYDAVNNLARVAYADGKTVSYEYNLLNQVIGMRDWLGTTDYELDALGRIKKVRDYQDRLTEYTWGRSGEKESLKYPDGSLINYDYDRMGRISRVTDAKQGVTAYQYDPLGNVTEKLLPNGVKTVYEYDKLARLVHQTDRNANGKILEEYRYTYDAAGNKLTADSRRDLLGLGMARDETVGVSRYKYDALNQLVEAQKPDERGGEKYFYDTLGNRIRKEKLGNDGIFCSATGYRYDLQNRLVEINGKGEVIVGAPVDQPVQLEYDQRGNLTRLVSDGKPLGEYAFDAANKLVRAVNHLGLVSTYTYDGADRRVKLAVELPQAPHPGDGLAPQVGVLQNRNSRLANLPETLRKEFPGVGDELLMDPERKVAYDYVPDATAPYNDVLMVYGKRETQRYTYGLDVLTVDTVQPGGNGRPLPDLNPERAYFLQNELGSPMRWVDESGKSKAVYSYDAFGRPIMTATPMGGKKTPGAGSNIFSYTGYQHDPSGLMFAQARYYLPEMGRFMSEDPSKDGENWYVRCMSNPLKYIDPDGYKILLASTNTKFQNKTVLGNIQKLTNDDLEIRNNEIVIAKKGMVKTKPVGTLLVGNLAGSSKLVTIYVDDTKGNFENDVSPVDALNPKKGSDTMVSFNPNSDPLIPTLDPKTGLVSERHRPGFVGLAHELIHANRSMNGKAINYGVKVNYSCNTAGGLVECIPMPQEEYETVGLLGNEIITENNIRLEQGLNPRGAYTLIAKPKPAKPVTNSMPWRKRKPEMGACGS
jgi:RHS repeat-associated protein